MIIVQCNKISSHNVIGYCRRNVLHYEHTVATYNVITAHKVIPAHNLKQSLLYVYNVIIIFQYKYI